MKKGEKFATSGFRMHLKKHPLKWFTDRIGCVVYGECNPYTIQDVEHCELLYSMQNELDAKFTEYYRGNK